MSVAGKRSWGGLFAAALVLAAALAQADGQLRPGQVITLTFPELAQCRLLLLRGDQPEMKTMRPGQPPVDARAFLNKIFDAVDGMARARGLDWTQVVMRGRGHGFEPEFQTVVGQWARGEVPNDVPPKRTARSEMQKRE